MINIKTSLPRYLLPLAVCPELQVEADGAHDGDEDDDDGDHADDGGQGGVGAPLVLGPHPGPRPLGGLSVGHLDGGVSRGASYYM